MSTRVVPLGDLCQMHRQGLRPDDPLASQFPFVGVENVSAGTGIVIFDTGSRIGSQKSTAFRFDERHVLYAKLRPYLNKVATPGFTGRCSTELVPLLPRDGVNRDFLAHLLRRKQTVEFVMASVTGTRMPRTDMKALMSMPVSFPPLEEQRRIAGILNRTADIERLRAQATDRLGEFIPALFIKMFGDHDQIANRFPCIPLREVTAIGSGITKGRKIDLANAIEVPYLRVANVQDGFLNLHEIKTITIKRGEEKKYELVPGDLVMTEGGDPDKLGRAAIWNGELRYCAHQNHIFRVRPHTEILLTDYLREAAASAYGKDYFLSVAKQTTGIASINKTQLGNFPVPIPPIDLQNRYAETVASAYSIAATSEIASNKASALSASFVSRLLDNCA